MSVRPMVAGTARCWDMAGRLISMPSRTRLGLALPAASFSKIARRVGSAIAQKMSFSAITDHMSKYLCDA